MLCTNEENTKQIWNDKIKDVNCDKQGIPVALQSIHDFFKVLGFIVELSTYILNPNGSFEDYPSTR